MVTVCIYQIVDIFGLFDIQHALGFDTGTLIVCNGVAYQARRRAAADIDTVSVGRKDSIPVGQNRIALESQRRPVTGVRGGIYTAQVIGSHKRVADHRTGQGLT